MKPETKLTCKCGNPSVGRDLVCRYTKKDGTVKEYHQKEKRCHACINASRKKSKYKVLDNIGYAY